MSPDYGMDLTYLLIKPCLSRVSGRGGLRNRFLCGDVLHVVEVWVDLGKTVLDTKSALSKGERKQKLVLSRSFSWTMSGEVSPMQTEGWRAPRLCSFCPGVELKAMRQGLSPGLGSCSPWEGGGFLGTLWTLVLALTSLPLLYPSSSQWC